MMPRIVNVMPDATGAGFVGEQRDEPRGAGSQTEARDSRMGFESLDPLCAVAWLLRGFATAGEDLLNPIVGFNREYRESSDSDGYLRQDSRMRLMSNERFDAEKDYAEQAGALWNRNAMLSPEELFVALNEREPLIHTDVLSQECGSFPRQSCEMGGLSSWLTSAWLEHPLACALVKSHRYLHDCDGHANPRERKLDLSSIDNTATIVERDCIAMFAGKEAVENPLSALRRLDDAGQRAFADIDDRVTALSALEGLSRRIWKLQTSIGVSTLVIRLTLQEDGGLGDLELIDAYGSLVGALPRHNVAPAFSREALKRDEVSRARGIDLI